MIHETCIAKASCPIFGVYARLIITRESFPGRVWFGIGLAASIPISRSGHTGRFGQTGGTVYESRSSAQAHYI